LRPASSVVEASRQAQTAARLNPAGIPAGSKSAFRSKPRAAAAAAAAAAEEEEEEERPARASEAGP
jgi:hypothetical protein